MSPRAKPLDFNGAGWAATALGTIQFKAEDATGTGYLAIPQRSRGPGVIVLHAWWGLNDFFKGLCDRLTGEGFVAFGLDLYHGRTASTIEGAKELIGKHDLNPPKKEVAGSVDFSQGASRRDQR